MAHALTLDDVRQKLRIVKPKAAGKDTPVTIAYPTTRVTALEDGLNLNRQDGGLVKFTDMSLLLAFRLDSDPDTWYMELFVYGQETPFRLSQKVINYRQFLPEISQRSKDNFYAFFLYLINKTDSVYVDEYTLEFLKSRKMISYPDFQLYEDYTRQLWFQLITWMKFRCDQCGEVYWVDDAKISPKGAKTKCVKCQNIITVQQREKPKPLVPKEQRKTNPCPHCGYENSEGAQFCVMCQKPLVDFIPKAAPQPEPSPQAGAEQPQEQQEPQPPSKPKASLSLEFAGLPLQAREQRSPNLSLRELSSALQDDIKTLENPFGWFTQFSRIMQWLGFVFLAGGILLGVYIYYVMPAPALPKVLTDTQRMTYAGISAGVGFLLSLACIIVSNIIALTLEVERNTKVTALLIQRLISKQE
ncbi:hypothetical protein U27_05054 [Candidatus Vecturithrix granuli]|uniref:Uncharacterized protein n=1 Tax=Vecturithrix granuli TaxID=1499967 RepID=A0A081C0H6_VECG1|nr:hypothetical protein U27_05054 [Candidatus Vecturithrix granuli]